MSTEATQNEVELIKERDFFYNRVSSSRFIFLLTLACVAAATFGECYRLYQQRYKGKPDIEIQSSTKYTPEYK